MRVVGENVWRANARSVPLRSRERQAFADGEAFDLAERRRVRQIQVVAPIDAARHDDADRRLVRLHVPNLHRRGVRAEQRAPVRRSIAGDWRSEIQRVLHVARGMFRRHVEGIEAVPVVLDLGALDGREPHAAEDGFEVVAHDRQRMAVPQPQRTSRQGHVDRARRPRLRRGGGLVLGPARLDRLLQFVGQPADLAFAFRRGAGDRLHPRRRRRCFSARGNGP